MKIIAIPAILSGLLLTILVLRVAHSNYAEVGEISIYALIPNLLTGLLALAAFRGKTGTGVYKGLLIAGYLVGIAGGIYFYYT